MAILCILGVLTIAVFNVCGVNVTKHISALTRYKTEFIKKQIYRLKGIQLFYFRSIADVSRTLLVWILSIIITVTAGKGKGKYSGNWHW